MFSTNERSTPVFQKEEAPLPGQGEFLDKFDKLEGIVADVLASTNGAASSAASAAVDAAVRRARQKAKMLPSLGSGLVLAALDEVAYDVASLPQVSIANAAIMRQLTEDMINTSDHPAPSTPLQAGGAAAPPSSVRSVRGDQVPPNPDSLESGGGYGGGTASEQPSSPESTTTAQPHPSSVYTTIQEPGSGATTSAMDEELESTAGTADAATTATAHRIVEPLRYLFAETCSTEQHYSECALIRRNLRLKKPKSGDLRIAKEVDFDRCASPRPHTPSSSPSSSPHKSGKLGTPRVRGACLEFGLDATGSTPLKVEPMHRNVDQYSPMTPGGTGTGGTGRILTLKGDHGPHTTAGSRQPHSQRLQQQRHWRSGTASPKKSLSQGASPRGGSGELRVGGMNVCESGAPPGLLPTARVEGSVAIGGGIGGERVGDTAPSWFDPVQGEEVGESGTSMVSEIDDVCSQLQSSGL